jgi:N-acetyl sugar amidotransferase
MYKLNNSFKYGMILSLNSSPRIAECFQAIQDKCGNERMLAATFNHRFYNIYDKNYIKNLTDIHDLDHIMFSMKPSSKQLLAILPEYELKEFQDLSQVIFVLQLLGRYNIDSAVLDTRFLETGEKGIIHIRDIETQISTFLSKVEEQFKHINVRKQFPMLFSVKKVLPHIQSKNLVLLDSCDLDPNFLAYDYTKKQINELEKDLFWLGFDSEYKVVTHDKEYPETKWTAKAKHVPHGKGFYDKEIAYCSRCCLPETMEGIELDHLGVCVPCRSSEDKMHINWEERKQLIENIFHSHKTEDYYDCLLPMSGGKDSTYQAHILNKIIKVTPLAVTASQSWQSLEGRYNLENCLQKFDLDHIFFVKARNVVNKVAKKSLNVIGDACWHCHIATGVFPIQSALVWDLKLMCYGESLAESDGRDSYREKMKRQENTSVYYNLDVSARVKAEDMVDDKISEQEMYSWTYPPKDSLDQSKIQYIHIGDYFFWDEEKQVEFVKRNYEWMDFKVENTYKGYKSIECVMAGVHDYANFIKRGVGRATIQASEDVRRGLMTREEGFELTKKYDTQRPHALDYYLKITGLTEEEFEAEIKLARNKSEYAMKLEQIHSKAVEEVND